MFYPADLRSEEVLGQLGELNERSDGGHMGRRESTPQNQPAGGRAIRGVLSPEAKS